MTDKLDGPAPRRGFSVRPEGIVAGPAASALRASGAGLSLAGGPLVFTLCDIVSQGRHTVLPIEAAKIWAERDGHGSELAAALIRLNAPRKSFAGLSLDQPRIMGVVNVTPDSFSDGGDFADAKTAIAHGLALREAGADILDIGGESTRPRSDPVPVEEELRRVIPVVKALARAGALVSIDTRRAVVMKEAIAAGASIVNDVTALTGDPDSMPTVAEAKVHVVLMHMQGEPKSMQENPTYADAPRDIRDYFVDRLAASAMAGIAPERIAVDPGIGFGKNDSHNIELIRDIGVFHDLGVAVVLGISRKSFIGRLSRREPARQRLPGSLAAGLAGLDRGSQILRVHDVDETRQALAIWRALAIWQESATSVSSRP